MRNRLVIVLALLGLTYSGCATEDTQRVARGEAAASRPDESAPGSAVAPTPPAADPGATAAAQPGAPADPSAPAVPGATGTVRNTRTLEEVGVAIEAAIAAAAAVPSDGDDLCGISYRGLQAMTEQLRRTMPEQPSNPLPQRDAFLEVCRDMPQEVQRCLVISYAVDHQEECELQSTNLDPALRARIDALMNTAPQQAPAGAP